MKFLEKSIAFFERYPAVHQKIVALNDSQTFKRLLSGSFWNAILNFFSKGISFIGTIIIIRIIGREAFGEFGMLNATIAMFGMFTMFSISQTATKYIAEFRHSDKEKASRIIGISFLFSGALGILIFGIIMLSSEYIAVHSMEAPHLEGSLRLMATGMLFGSLNGAQYGVVNGLEAFKLNSFLGIGLGIALAILKVGLTFLYGFEGAIWGLTLEPVITYFATFWLTRKIVSENKLTIKFKGALKEYKILFAYSLPSMLSGFILFPTNWYTMTILATAETGGYSELAAFNASNQWFNVLVFIPYIIVSAFLPVFSDLISRNKLREVQRIISNSSGLLLVIFIPLTLIFFVWGDQIAMIYGEEFAGTGYLLGISVFTLIPMAISIVYSNLLAASGRIWYTCGVTAIWSVVFIGLSFAFISHGANGLLWARFIAYGVNLLLMFFLYYEWKSRKSMLKTIANDSNI